jgi:hypothetical protein
VNSWVPGLSQGYTGIVRALVAARADPTLAQQDGATPVYVASQNGHTAVLEALLPICDVAMVNRGRVRCS